MPLHSLDELRGFVDEYLSELPLAKELGRLEETLRYALESGGKRIRPVLSLAVAEAAGGAVDVALPGAAAVELVHTFSLVHDDLPALDDDELRRGRPSAHVRYGEGAALLAGDALLAEAFRLALTYSSPRTARELADATLGMIGGQYRDISGDDGDLGELHRLKTGRLFAAAVGVGLEAADVSDGDQPPWRAFSEELGLLFQIVDDIIDGDGFAERVGAEQARALADAATERARRRLDDVPANTSVLRQLVDTLSVRSA
jgi:geranylgeranyl diphosphate synthase type II